MFLWLIVLWILQVTHIKNDKSSGVTKKIKATTDWGKEWKTSYFNWVNPNSKYFPTNKSEVLKKKGKGSQASEKGKGKIIWQEKKDDWLWFRKKEKKSI